MGSYDHLPAQSRSNSVTRFTSLRLSKKCRRSESVDPVPAVPAVPAVPRVQLRANYSRGRAGGHGGAGGHAGQKRKNREIHDKMEREKAQLRKVRSTSKNNFDCSLGNGFSIIFLGFIFR